MYGQSQASLSKTAKEKTAAAQKAEDGVSSSNPESYSQAAQAHHSAAWANQDAGNGTQADKHRKAAKQFDDKASEHYRAKDFAEGESRAAETLSRSAGLSGFGKDPKDSRTPEELHTAAADAHERASKAHDLAECTRDSAYHAAKAEEHRGLAAKAAKGGDGASSGD